MYVRPARQIGIKSFAVSSMRASARPRTMLPKRLCKTSKFGTYVSGMNNLLSGWSNHKLLNSSEVPSLVFCLGVEISSG